MGGVAQASSVLYTPWTDSAETGTLLTPSGFPLDPLLSRGGVWLDNVLIRPPRPGRNRPFGIIGLHGHGANSLQFGVGAYAFSPGSHTRALVEAGFIHLGIDGGGAAPFANDKTIQRFLDAYRFLVGVLGCHPEVGLHGWSMGGLSALNILARYPQLIACAWLWVPLLDLRWARSDAGYAAPGSGAFPNNSTYNTEIDAAYAPSTVSIGYATEDWGAGTNISGTIYAAANNTPMRVHVASTEGFDDAIVGGPANFTVNGNAATYTRKDATTFYGVVSTGANFGIPNGGATVAQTWNQLRNHYSPMSIPSTFQGKGVDVCYALASDDTVIPPVQADTWLAGVNDPRHFLRPGGKVTGGHTGLFGNIPYGEVVDFFTSHVHNKQWAQLARNSDRVDAVPTKYATVAAMAASGRTVVNL